MVSAGSFPSTNCVLDTMEEGRSPVRAARAEGRGLMRSAHCRRARGLHAERMAPSGPS